MAISTKSKIYPNNKNGFQNPRWPPIFEIFQVCHIFDPYQEINANLKCSLAEYEEHHITMD